VEFLEVDFWLDPSAWTIGGLCYILFMGIMWFTEDLGGSQYNPLHKGIITIGALPLCYVTAKIMLNRG